MTVNELMDWFDQTFKFNQDIYNLTDADERYRYKRSFYRIRMNMKKKEDK
jgi:hypothetical protein